MTALEELAGFRADRPTVRAKDKEPWRPLTPDRLRTGAVLAFDQSLRNTGWCLLLHDAQIGPEVALSGTCRTKKTGERTGWDEVLHDAESIAVQVEDVVTEALVWLAGAAPRFRPGLVVAHESPPQGGGKHLKPEISLVTGLGIRLAARRAGLPVAMRANQPVKRLLLDCVDGKKEPGPDQVRIGDVDKAMIARAVNELAWLEGRHLLTNEHQRDAAGVGLLHLTKEVA